MKRLAVIVGLIFSLHNLIPWLMSRQAGMVFTPFNNGDENIYAAQVVAAAEGRLTSGEFFSGLPWLGPALLGFFANFIGVEAVFILADLILPPLVFYLFFRLARELKVKHVWSLAAALAALFLYQLFTKINPLDWLKPQFFNFNRLIPPQLTYVFFLLFLISLVRKSIWSGVWAGILAYVYFYHWSAALLILLLSRQWRALLLAGAISLPYLWQAGGAPLEYQLRFGRIEGRFLEPLTTARYLLMLFLAYRFRIRILAAIFAAAVVLMNLQLVTGLTIAPGHWPGSTFEPLVAFSLVALVVSRLKPVWGKLLIALALTYALINQILISWQWRQMYWLKPEEKALFNDLKRLPGRPLVMSLDKKINFFLPVLADSRPYLPYGSYSSLSDEELWQRFICAMSLSKLDEAEIEAKLNDTQLVGQLFDLAYNQGLTAFSFGQRRLPEEKKQWVRQALVAEPACPFAVDYIISSYGQVYAAGN